MALFCPRPCGRLATAAVFIAVGVVQLLVGVILLRSKFANLLSGADFLTSATNICIGCLYGIASSVWRNKENRIPTKRTAKKNTLAALLTTVIAVNATTVFILIMSDGNELLSSPFFKDRSGHIHVEFAKEIFVCAYVASLCSPIVCLVVALVGLSGNCFHMYCVDNVPRQNTSVDKIKNPFDWVYEERVERKPRNVSNTSTGSSSFKNSAYSTGSSSSSVGRQSVLYTKGASPVRVWKQKRTKILKRDSLSRKWSPSDPHYQKEHFVKDAHKIQMRMIKGQTNDAPVVKTSTKIPKCIDTIDKVPKFDGIASSSNGKKVSKNRCYLGSQGNESSKVRSDSYAKAISGENEIHKETKFQKGTTAIREATGAADQIVSYKQCSRRSNPRHFETINLSLADQERNYVTIHQSPSRSLNAYLKEGESVESEITRLKLQTLQELKIRVKQGVMASKLDAGDLNTVDVENKEQTELKSLARKTNPQKNAEFTSASGISSPGEVFESPKPTSLGNKPFQSKEFSCSETNSTISTNCSKPLDLTIKKMNADIKKCQSLTRLPTECSSPKSALLASRDEIFPYKEREIGKAEYNNPIATPSNAYTIKREMFMKSASLASIAEVPSEEGIGSSAGLGQESPQVTNSTPSSGGRSGNVDENSNITIHSSASRKFPEHSSSMKCKAFSPKNILRKMWSSGPEVRMSVSDLIVDEDSLIGLSDEELLSRTLRLRSLRKDVEDRLKRQTVEKNVVDVKEEC